jgi:ribosomal subunit interface protein
MTTIQIAFRGLPASQAVESRIAERVERLERIHPGLIRSHVVVHAPHQHRRHGKLFDVRIQLHYPGVRIDIREERANDQAHEDVYVAIRDRFDAAERQLHGRLRKQDHRRPGREERAA